MTARRGKKRHWGIPGAGTTARKFVAAPGTVDGAELSALAGRHPGRARSFADDFGASRAYGGRRQVGLEYPPEAEAA